MKGFLYFALFAFFLLIAGCEKQPLDYRNKFLGDYSFQVHYSWWHMLGGTFDTTYTSEGNIWYGSDPHTVLITFSEGKSVEFTVYEDGTLGPQGYSYGEFESGGRVSFSWSPYSGHGAGSNYEVTGDKK